MTKTTSTSSHRSVSLSIVPPIPFHPFRVPDQSLGEINNKNIRSFYKHQNQLIDRFEQVDRIVEALQEGQDRKTYGAISDSGLRQQPRNTEDIESNSTTTAPLFSAPSSPSCSTSQQVSSNPLIIRLAINISFLINIGLFVLKLTLAYFSGSMAILATAFESLLDILSGAIIFCAILFIRKKDYYKYPVGKARMEPIGIIVFSVVITTSFGQVLLTSIQQLANPKESDQQIHLDVFGVGLLLGNILIKLMLWLWCAGIQGSSSVQALAQDHKNDVVFNSASAIFPIIAVYAKASWVDPTGAIILSLYIIYEWLTLLLGNAQRLAGQVANTDDIKQFTYLAYRFSNKILAVDTVRAYYIGDRLLVEVDIILPPHFELHEAHDIGEDLQNALEMMDNVERAFVHLDYNASHQVEHMRVVNDIGFGRD